jgi:hypothetical protein
MSETIGSSGCGVIGTKANRHAVETAEVTKVVKGAARYFGGS